MSPLEVAVKLAPTLLGWLPGILFRRACLLVVEDNATSAKLMKELIEFEGHHCEVVDTITSAETLLRSKRYAVLFLDMRLPGTRKGWTFVNEVMQEFPQTHVVVVCGAPEDLGRIHHGLYVGVILKPASNRSIRDVLRKSRL